jgi:hypothetical protein
MINIYFDSSIHILIDEMKMLMSGLDEDSRKGYANTKFAEADFAIRLGSPFRHLARYPMQGAKGQDIIIDYKDFEVEIKYWRNWFGGTGTQKATWENSYGRAFNWLRDEIKNGKKNNRAMICGWFTFFEWRELLQLGCNSGRNPLVNAERLKTLPFLSCKDGKIRTIQTKYFPNCGEIEIKESDYLINWELHGNESDVLNILMLY